MTINEIREIFSSKISISKRFKYTLGRKLGEGSNGAVFKDITKNIAIKRIKIDKSYSELRQHCNLSGKPYVCPILEINYDDVYVYIILKYCEKDLFYYVYESKELLLTERKLRWFDQILQVVKSCHDNNIIHCDLKLENFMIDENDDICLIDFGLSRNVDDIKRSKIGTLEYLCPEIINESLITTKNDIWACGIL
jgi:serine/threonine protein kinase